MQRISICAMKKNRKAILEELQSLGVLEIDAAELDPELKTMDTMNARMIFEKNASLCDQAIEILDEFSKEKESMLASLAGNYLTDNIGNRYLEPGTFEIKVGTASDRIVHRISIEVGSKLEKTPVVDSPQIIKVTPSGEFITVQGFVRDAQATPVAYVTVRAISSGQETQTDEKGFYSINLRTDDSIAFVKARFITQQMEVKGRKNINIRLVK